MYKKIVSGRVQQVFEELSKGDSALLLSGMSDDAVHVVDGDHALSGTRSNPEDIAAWYARLFTLFPDLSFVVHDVIVKGLPSRTTAIAVWEDSSTTSLSEQYKNSGVNVIELSWGKVQSVHIYTDTQHMAGYLQKLGSLEPEALAEPIIS